MENTPSSKFSAWDPIAMMIYWIGLVLTIVMIVIELIGMNPGLAGSTGIGSIVLTVPFLFGSAGYGIVSLMCSIFPLAGFTLMIRKNSAGRVALLAGLVYTLFFSMLCGVVVSGMNGVYGATPYTNGLMQGIVASLFSIAALVCYFIGRKNSHSA